MFNLHLKQFKALNNSENREINNLTVFEYFQDDNLIWANYKGGDIKAGKLKGQKTAENGFELIYEQTNKNGEVKSGFCKTQVSFSREGKIILNEYWTWTSGDQSSGESTLIEI